MRIATNRQSTAASPLAEGRELKYLFGRHGALPHGSPLAEGRELKCARFLFVNSGYLSPLAEGRELKFLSSVPAGRSSSSPLAEGRELKCLDFHQDDTAHHRRPSRRGVN